MDSGTEGDVLICPICGIDYDSFKTGLSYSEVFEMFWVGDPKPENWRYKRRNTVLGKWHQIKKEMWQEHLENCKKFEMPNISYERIEY